MRIAFDLDGTLITAAQRQTFLLKSIAARYGVFIDPSELWALKRSGMSNSQILQGIGLSGAITTKIHNAWLHDIESPYWLSLDTVFADTHLVLKDLLGHGFYLSLLTARRNTFLLLNQLCRLQLRKYFQEISVVSPAYAAKEKAELLRVTKPSFFIGDTESDLQASMESSTVFFAVSTGQRDEGYLKSAGAGKIFASLGNCLREIRGK